MAHQGDTQRLHIDAPTFVDVGSNLTDVTCDNIHAGLCLLQRHPWLQSGEHLHVVHAALLGRALDGIQRPQVAFVEDAEAGRDYADDGGRFSVHIQRAAQHLGI